MSNKIGTETRKKLNRSIPYVLTVVGLMIALRGMNLGIPFVSPRISVPKTGEVINKDSSEKENTTESTVQMDCCHSKETCSE